jgi:hypothetical protein
MTPSDPTATVAIKKAMPASIEAMALVEMASNKIPISTLIAAHRLRSVDMVAPSYGMRCSRKVTGTITKT